MRLDARDRRLLSVVAREGRITNQALALRVHLSPSACLERWKRLEQAGVIKGYQALVERLLEAEIGISRYFTYVVTKTVKDDPAGLVAVLLAEAEDPAAGR